MKGVSNWSKYNVKKWGKGSVTLRERYQTFQCEFSLFWSDNSEHQLYFMNHHRISWSMLEPFVSSPLSPDTPVLWWAANPPDTTPSTGQTHPTKGFTGFVHTTIEDYIFTMNPIWCVFFADPWKPELQETGWWAAAARHDAAVHQSVSSLAFSRKTHNAVPVLLMGFVALCCECPVCVTVDLREIVTASQYCDSTRGPQICSSSLQRVKVLFKIL